MISRRLSSGGILDWLVFAGTCFREEQRKPRWRVAVRRCSEFSETQRRRADPPSCFRKTKSSFALRLRVKRMPGPCGVLRQAVCAAPENRRESPTSPVRGLRRWPQ